MSDPNFIPTFVRSAAFPTIVSATAMLVIVLATWVWPMSPAVAQSPSPAMLMKKFDRNGDGRITRKEWRGPGNAFKKFDTDRSGYLTRKELDSKLGGNGEGKAKKNAANKTEKMKHAEKEPGTEVAQAYWQGPIIDVHSQVDEKTDLEKIVPLLDKAGVARVILSTRFKQPSSDVADLAARHPDRIVAAAKTKTKAVMKGLDSFPQIFLEDLERHEFGAMAEIIMWHAAKKGVGAGKAVIEPDDPRISVFMKTVRERGWPFVAHFEFAAMGGEKSRFMDKFEAMLGANRDVPIGLIHMGQLKAGDAARLLPAHANLFFITSHSNPVTLSKSKLPWTRMFAGEELAPAWRDLVLKYPDRFVLGFDNVFYFHWEDLFLPQVEVWRKALAKLPDAVAHALAHGNAERLWKLPPALAKGAEQASSTAVTPAPTQPSPAPAEAKPEDIEVFSPFKAKLNLMQARGFVATGLRPVFPAGVDCPIGTSTFASRTRSDGSKRSRKFYRGYHGGYDIPAEVGRPIIAVADGTVVHMNQGVSIGGIGVILQHAPEDTGLGAWVYTEYKHLKEMPDLQIGQRLKKGQQVGLNGKTGTIGGHYGSAGFAHLHLTAWYSARRETTTTKMLIPVDGRWMDPLALFRGEALLDSHAVKKLSDDAKKVAIPHMTTDGRFHPEASKVVWPFICALKG